ncbi:MAG: gliding motility-associated-like protein [Crocinitomicaceae bacterium]|jgi:gliding motility-associated-like protein
MKRAVRYVFNVVFEMVTGCYHDSTASFVKIYKRSSNKQTKMINPLLKFIIIALVFPNISLAQPPNLGATTDYAIFTSVGALGNTGTTTNITGHIGTHVGAITGFGAPNVVVGNIELANAATAQCLIDVQAAYNEIVAITPTVTSHPPAFGTETLTAGVYNIGGAGSLGGNLILDAEGNPDTLFIFQFGGAFSAGAASSVILTGGALACNVFWIAEGAMDLAANTNMKGTLISNNGAIGMGDGVILEGRMLTTGGAASIYNGTINLPICSIILSVCDLVISASAIAESCAGNDGSIDLTIAGSSSAYDVLINGVIYNSYSTGTYSIPSLADGMYQIIAIDTLSNSCQDTIDVIVLDGGASYSVIENITSCLNDTVIYPDNFNQVIIANTSHTSNLLTTQGCDSIIVTNVSVLVVINDTVNETICNGSQFISPQANSYGAGSFDETYTSSTGCDSIVTFVVTEQIAYASTVNETICNGSQFMSPGGNSYGAGSYDETYTSATGCDSTVTFVVTEQIAYASSVNETICNGSQFMSPGGNSYGAGSYDETYSSATGCDSTVTFVVTEQIAYASTVNETICNGSQFTSPQANSYGAGSFDETYTSATGCDSTVAFVVTEQIAYASTVNETVCNGSQFTSPQANSYGAGSFDETYTSATGCDSTVTFVVTEQIAYASTVNETICNGSQFMSPGGNSYGAGSFDETYTSATGCDSTVTFVVTEQIAYASSVNETICNGSQFTSPQANSYGAGSYDETYSSATGCDSTVTFVVTEQIAYASTVNETICNGSQFMSPGGNSYGAGSYDETYSSATGCDSTVTFVVTEQIAYASTVNETICNGSQFTSPQANSYGAGSFDETYTSATGCDSTVTFVVTEQIAYASSVNETICNGSQFMSPGGNSYGAGSFDETYTSSTGCDSTVTFVVTEQIAYASTVNETICNGSQFMSPGGNSYGAGSYDETYSSATGCDSTVTFVVTEQIAYASTVNETICNGSQFTSPQANSYGAGSFDETYTSATGCDSTVTFVVTEQIAYTSTVNETICNGSQFMSPGGNSYGAGSYDETYTSATGCDSTVTFVVTEQIAYTSTVNETICNGSQFTSPQANSYGAGSYDETYTSATGCDSTVTFVVTEQIAYASTVNETICNGSQFISPQANSYGAGSFDETYTSSTGCDSTVTFVVTEQIAYTSTVNETICNGSQFMSPGGNSYGAGSYDETYTSATGCDSTVTFVVTEQIAYASTVNETICNGSQFMSPGGNSYGAGSYDETYTSATGCDSTVTFVVTEQIAYASTVNETICNGSQFTSPQANSYGAGSYDETYTSATGCDSTVTFVVTEQIAYASTVNETICNGSQFISPQANSYGAGSYDEMYSSATGCDSTVTFVVTEQIAYASTVNETICNGSQFISPQANSYGAGSYDEMYSSAAGCDSIVTFVVTEQIIYTSTVNETICNGSQFTSPQANSYGAGSYDETYTSATGCDSTVTFVVTEQIAYASTVNETICFGSQFMSPQGNIYGAGSFDETYTSATGCDSAVTFVITDLGPIINTVYEYICYGDEYITSQGNVFGPGTYTESLISSNGCDSVVILIISEYDQVTADFFFNSVELTSLNSEVQFINTSSGAQYYIWDFGDQTLNSSDFSPIHQFELFEAETYDVTLIAINEFGCTDSIVKKVVVKEELIFYIPNTFTPDGNELNQTFTPVFTSGFDPFDYSLLIFNRWGELVFESHDAKLGWDGSYKGQYSQDGSYIWKIEFKDFYSAKRYLETGHMNLLR